MKLVSLALAPGFQHGNRILVRQALSQTRFTSSSVKSESGNQSNDAEKATKKEKMDRLKTTHKSMAELDDEMKHAMENLLGDGGESGLELEDGKPVSMKRSVKENMFRYI